MPAVNTPVCDFGLPAVDFELLDSDGQVWTLEKSRGAQGLLVMFICNHCPYVKSIIKDLVVTTDKLKKLGINTIAIMPNDWHAYPDDAPDKMVEFKQQFNFSFPYLIDNTQTVAKKYGAVCTPDFFGYNKELQLQYRGRFDARGRHDKSSNQLYSEHELGENELEKAMIMIAKTTRGPLHQNSSIGCSIKWHENNY